MKEIITDLLRRYTSRKFVTAVGGFTLIMLDGLGAAEFSAEVLGISATALVAYIGAEGISDTVERYKSNGNP